MPRQPIDLDPYKNEIISQFKRHIPTRKIAEHLSDAHGVIVQGRTIQRRLKEWDIQIPTNRNDGDNPVIRARIAVLFFECCLSDKNIIKVLQQEGHQITPRNLAEIRRRMDLYRKVNLQDKEASEQALLEIVQKELDNKSIEGLGRGLLYTHFRKNGHIVSRDRLFAAVRKLDPAGVARRLHDLQKHRGEYVIPGPNYLWSIDGYCKLRFWGIDIYAAIDAYSRYIVWIYIGISNCTAVSVLQQYIDVMSTHNVLPQILRTDRGVQTPLIAAAHHAYIKKQRPEASFDDCLRYGTSTSNRRIEAWWGQLTKSVLFLYRDYFLDLSQKGHFQKNSTADAIAIQAIYIPILRSEVQGFARIWNTHSIRHQPRRPNSISGQPVMLYHWPGDDIQDYGIKPDTSLLKEFQEKLSEFDINEYLPIETKTWCRDKLQDLGYPAQITGSQTLPDGSRMHHKAYLHLRQCIAQHISSGASPELKQLSAPDDGAWDWGGFRPTEGLRQTEVEEIDIWNEGL